MGSSLEVMIQMTSVVSPDQICPPKDLGKEAVILDVNALMAPFQMGFNLDKELSVILPEKVPVVPTSVVRELEMILKRGNDWRVKAALDLSRKYQLIDIKGKGDAPIFNLALKMKWPVVTMDRKLKIKLLDRGIPVIFVRGKGHLQLLEP